MKQIFLFFLGALFIGTTTNAQDLFGQDGKMIANNIEQIALLKNYSGYLDKGLSIAHNGLDLTHSFKNGEFGLHSGYYTSLLQVNPNVKKYPAAQNTLDVYAKMKILQVTLKGNISGTDLLAALEKQRIQGILASLMNAAGKDMDELSNLLTDGKYQLTDNERIARIDAVNKRILKKYQSLDGLGKRVNTVVTGRREQKANAAKLRQLYGMP